MDNNEFLLLLQAQLDEAKSKGLINTDIEALQKKINTLKLKAEIDDKTLNNLVNQIENIFGKKISIDVDTSKLQQIKNVSDDSANAVIQNEKKKQQAYKETSSTISQIQTKQDDILKKISLGDYGSSFENLKASYTRLGLTSDEVKVKTNDVAIALDKLKSKNLDTLIQDEEAFNNALKKSRNELIVLKTDLDKIYNPGKQTRLSTDIQNWLNKNTRASKEAKESLNAYYLELNDGRVSVERLKFIESELKKIDAEQRGLGKLGKNLKDQLTQAKDSFVQWMSVSSLVMALVYQLKRIPEEVKEVNAAMVELRKVSDASAQAVTDYFDDAADSAKRLGSSVSDMINATADWSRLGYNLPDAKQLAEVATLYKNVGDGIDINAANESLISTLQGFQMNTNEAMHIIDSFNEVGNNFAISSYGIGEALERSASSLHAAGNTLEESIGLITAANEVVQDPATIGTAYKTITMRIRAAKTEMEELGLDTEGMVESTASLQKEILALSGVDIMKNKDQFKSTYQILDELAQKWEDLTDIQRATITELIAGKRQGNVVSALMNNFDTAREATDAAVNSTGSALKEQKRYQEGIEYSLNKLEASFQTFSNHILDSDSFKGIIDFGSSTLNVLDAIITKFGTLNSISATLGGIFGTKNLG